MLVSGGQLGRQAHPGVVLALDLGGGIRLRGSRVFMLEGFRG